MSVVESDDMIRSIGIVYDFVFEIKLLVNGMYSIKVDMYFFGIIFFEMCYLLMIGMQKVDVIS